MSPPRLCGETMEEVIRVPRCADYAARVRGLLGDATPHLEERLQPPRPKVAESVAAANERARLERGRAAAQRAQEMEAGRIDARQATPDQMRARLAGLGLDGAVAAGMSSSPPPAPSPEAANDPDTKRRRSESEAEARVRRFVALARAA